MANKFSASLSLLLFPSFLLYSDEHYGYHNNNYLVIYIAIEDPKITGNQLSYLFVDLFWETNILIHYTNFRVINLYHAHQRTNLS